MALALLCAACGGSADQDDGRIRAVVTEAFTSKDPSVCTQLMTQAYVEQRESQRGRQAVLRCEQVVKDAATASTVNVRDVSVDGDHAEAELTHDGPDATFSPITLQLRRSGEGWKLDRLTALTVDRQTFLREVRRELSPAIADCVMREYALFSDDEIERAVLARSAALLSAPAVLCNVEPELRRTDLPPAVVTCAVRGLRQRLRDGRLGRLLGEDANSVQEFDEIAFEGELRQVTGRCAARY